MKGEKKKFFTIRCRGFPEVTKLIDSIVTIGCDEINIRRMIRSKIHIFEVKIRYSEQYESYGRSVIKEYKEGKIYK